MTKYVPLTEQLRKAIEGCGVSRYRIAKETGVRAETLCRFVNGQRGLTMEALDTLAQYLGLELRPVRKPRAMKGG
jgi:plasmid maintenance system antidote protein VapI